MVKLNVGGGKGHPKLTDWIVVDIRESADVAMDITKEKLPYEDNSVDLLFCSHTLEHIYRHDLTFVLDEFYRVLKDKTGILRISVPDIEKACRHYALGDTSFFRKSTIAAYEEEVPIGGLLANWFYSFRDDNLGNGHVHCFDFRYLKGWLEQSGFTSVKKMKFGKSGSRELQVEGLDTHKNDSLFVEARKVTDGR